MECSWRASRWSLRDVDHCWKVTSMAKTRVLFRTRARFGDLASFRQTRAHKPHCVVTRKDSVFEVRRLMLQGLPVCEPVVR
jgi:hypothetical protein